MNNVIYYPWTLYFFTLLHEYINMFNKSEMVYWYALYCDELTFKKPTCSFCYNHIRLGLVA